MSPSEGRPDLSASRGRSQLSSVGDPAPGFTLVLVLGWSAVATVVLATQLAEGRISAVFGLVALWMALWLLPGLFATAHSRAARHCRLAALGAATSLIVAAGWAMWA